MARKTKLTPELQQEMVEIFEKGATIADTCAAVGLGETTYYRWMQEGEVARTGKRREFWEAIKRSQSASRITAVETILDKSKENWQAAAWYLERSDPENWAKRTYAKIDGLDELIKHAERLGLDPVNIIKAMIEELANAESSDDS